MVGETERSLRKGLQSIVAAGPSIDAESAGAAAAVAADSTDQDIRIPAGRSNLKRQHTGSQRTASKIKRGMG